MKITALTRQKRNKERVNLYLDGSFAFGIMLNTAVALRIGQELTAAEVDSLKARDDIEKAKHTAINFISYRPRSVAEVRKNLKSKSYQDATIDLVIERLQELELVNDETFAEYWVEQRNTFKPRSQLALRSELIKKGVSPQAIDAVVADVDETAAAMQAARKQQHRWQTLSRDDFYKKAVGYLQRRGFKYDIIRETIDQLWQEIETDISDDI